MKTVALLLALVGPLGLAVAAPSKAATAAEPPARQTIGPDGRQIRDSPENEEDPHS